MSAWYRSLVHRFAGQDQAAHEKQGGTFRSTRPPCRFSFVELAPCRPARTLSGRSEGPEGVTDWAARRNFGPQRPCDYSRRAYEAGLRPIDCWDRRCRSPIAAQFIAPWPSPPPRGKQMQRESLIIHWSVLDSRGAQFHTTIVAPTTLASDRAYLFQRTAVWFCYGEA